MPGDVVLHRTTPTAGSESNIYCKVSVDLFIPPDHACSCCLLLEELGHGAPKSHGATGMACKLLQMRDGCLNDFSKRFLQHLALRGQQFRSRLYVVSQRQLGYVRTARHQEVFRPQSQQRWGHSKHS